MEKTKLLRSSVVNLNTKRAILSAVGLMLSAGNALAEASNVKLTSNLQPLGDLGNQIMSLSKWAAVTIAVLSLLWLWASGNYARLKTKMHEAIGSQEHIKSWMIESVLVVLALIILYDFVIPYVNSFIP